MSLSAKITFVSKEKATGVGTFLDVVQIVSTSEDFFRIFKQLQPLPKEDTVWQCVAGIFTYHLGVIDDQWTLLVKKPEDSFYNMELVKHEIKTQWPYVKKMVIV